MGNLMMKDYHTCGLDKTENLGSGKCLDGAPVCDYGRAMSRILNNIYHDGRINRYNEQIAHKETSQNYMDPITKAMEEAKESLENKGGGLIIVGSRNSVKIEAVRVNFPGYRVLGFEADSGIRSQPIGREETLKGSLNRLNHCKNSVANAVVYVGIENGLIEHTDGWYDAPIITLAYGEKEPIIITGCEIKVSYKGEGDMERYMKEVGLANNRVTEYFTHDKVTRFDIIRQAVKVAKNTRV